MMRHRQRPRTSPARLGGATVAVVLVVGSLLSFGLGQEARHLVHALGLAPNLAPVVARQVASSQAIGALGAPPAASKATSKHTTKKRTTHASTARGTPLRQPARRVTTPPPNQVGCPAGTTLIEQQSSWQMTPQGESRFSLTICAGNSVVSLPGMQPQQPQQPPQPPVASPGWPPNDSVYGQPHMPTTPPATVAQSGAGYDSSGAYGGGYDAPPFHANPADPDDGAGGIVASGIEVHTGRVTPPIMVVVPNPAG